MISRLFASLVLVLAASLVPRAAAHSIEIAPGSKECFFEDLSAKDVVSCRLFWSEGGAGRVTSVPRAQARLEEQGQDGRRFPCSRAHLLIPSSPRRR